MNYLDKTKIVTILQKVEALAIAMLLLVGLIVWGMH